MTPMTTAPGVLANTMGWLETELHGLDDRHSRAGSG